jgi:hypothetical protein
MIPNPRQRDIRVPCTQHLQPTQFSTTIPQNFISKAHPSLRKPQTFPTRLSNFDNFQPSNTDKKTSTCPTNQSGTPVLEPTAKARAAGLSSLFSPLLSSPISSYCLAITLNHILIANSVVTGDKKTSGIIRKYGLNMSRQAFREKAQDIGFVKVCFTSTRKRGEEERGDMRADEMQYR